ncbi:MAG: lasso peptide biosynthesis B2 protein [Pyrinomonadaceae bacterium]
MSLSAGGSRPLRAAIANPDESRYNRAVYADYESNQMLTTFQKICRVAFRGTRKFLLHPKDAWLLIRIAWWVTVFSAATRVCCLPSALQLIAASNRNSLQTLDSIVQKRLGHAVDLLLAIDVLWFNPICWKRAALLHRYLRLNGLDTQIVFGVRNEKDAVLSGHAWLEVNREPLLESFRPDYVVTYRFPSTPSPDPLLDLPENA